MLIKALVVSPFMTNCYIVAKDEEKDAIVIDPGDEAGLILKTLEKESLSLSAILNTHAHIDHTGNVGILKKKTQAPFYLHKNELELLRGLNEQAEVFGVRNVQTPTVDKFLEEGDLVIAGLKIKVILTPGHSPGGVCFLINDNLFSGDALFCGSIGRTDLTGGNYKALINSIKDKLLVLPQDTIVYPGHGPATTIGRENATNPFLR